MIDDPAGGVTTASRARTEVMSRTGFLGRFVREVVLDLMGKAALLHGLDELVDRGIVEEQSVSSVIVEYAVEERLVGRVSIDIDYQRHRLNCSRIGETFAVDLDRGSAAQVSEAIARLVAFFQKFREAARPAGRLLWTRRPDTADQSRVSSEPARSLEWADESAQTPPTPEEELEFAIEVCPEKLDEVTIRARHVDPRRLVKGERRE